MYHLTTMRFVCNVWVTCFCFTSLSQYCCCCYFCLGLFLSLHIQWHEISFIVVFKTRSLCADSTMHFHDLDMCTICVVFILLSFYFWFAFFSPPFYAIFTRHRIWQCPNKIGAFREYTCARIKRQIGNSANKRYGLKSQ